MIALAACARGPAYQLQEIGGLMPPLQFALTDQGGRAVSAADYRGKLVLLYFGYTHCPDACPTTLATLSSALHSLDHESAEVRVLFVSVDPARDSATVLKRYLAYFDPRFIGLRANEAALATLAQRYHVSYHRGTPDRFGDYAVDHSSAVFVFDRVGNVRLLATASDRADAIAADLHRLIAQG